MASAALHISQFKTSQTAVACTCKTHESYLCLLSDFGSCCIIESANCKMYH